VIRLDGSYVSIYLIKSIPRSLIRHSLGIRSFNATPGYLGKLIYAAVGRFFQPGHVSSVGVPSTLNI
jgi:hypothetical protein